MVVECFWKQLLWVYYIIVSSFMNLISFVCIMLQYTDWEQVSDNGYLREKQLSDMLGGKN